MKSPRDEMREIVANLKKWTDEDKIEWRKLPRFAHQCQISETSVTLEQVIGASDVFSRLTIGNLSTGPRVASPFYGLGALLDSIFQQYEKNKRYQFSDDCAGINPGVDSEFIKKLDKKNEKDFVDEWDRLANIRRSKKPIRRPK